MADVLEAVGVANAQELAAVVGGVSWRHAIRRRSITQERWHVPNIHSTVVISWVISDSVYWQPLNVKTVASNIETSTYCESVLCRNGKWTLSDRIQPIATKFRFPMRFVNQGRFVSSRKGVDPCRCSLRETHCPVTACKSCIISPGSDTTSDWASRTFEGRPSSDTRARLKVPPLLIIPAQERNCLHNAEFGIGGVGGIRKALTAASAIYPSVLVGSRCGRGRGVAPVVFPIPAAAVAISSRPVRAKEKEKGHRASSYPAAGWGPDRPSFAEWSDRMMIFWGTEAQMTRPLGRYLAHCLFQRRVLAFIHRGSATREFFLSNQKYEEGVTGNEVFDLISNARQLVIATRQPSLASNWTEITKSSCGLWVQNLLETGRNSGAHARPEQAQQRKLNVRVEEDDASSSQLLWLTGRINGWTSAGCWLPERDGE
ncbi:hypothetical protein DFH06DRAFT_1150129 [Mycena polygramma]|nr:hypothetical protein DFH06DRAFT_1150129 [Mycena polygramma]